MFLENRSMRQFMQNITEKFVLRVWAGPDEQRFMEASLAYAAGKPILTDAAYDELKMKLKVGF